VQSQYSYARPASTILTGLNQGHMAPPHSPAPFGGMQARQSTYSNLGGVYGNDRITSVGGATNINNNPFSNRPSMAFTPGGGSSDNLISPNSHMSYAGSTPNLLGAAHPGMSQTRVRSPLGFERRASRPVSTINFMDGPKRGPENEEIARAVTECLLEVDLDNMTKKQLKALIEQRLQTQLQGEKKAYLDYCVDEQLKQMGDA